METILDRGVKRHQIVDILPTVLPPYFKGIVKGVDFCADTVTVEITMPASWVHEP